MRLQARTSRAVAVHVPSATHPKAAVFKFLSLVCLSEERQSRTTLRRTPRRTDRGRLRDMQFLNPLGRDSARGSSWRQSSSEQMLSSGVFEPQSASWDVQPQRRVPRTPVRARGCRVAAQELGWQTHASYRSSAPDVLVEGLPVTFDTEQRHTNNPVSTHSSKQDISGGKDALPEKPSPHGSGKGWSSLRKAYLEHKLEAVGQRERENERQLGKMNAFTSKLLGVFEYYMDADNDEATEGEGQVLYYDNKELVRYGVFIQCVGTTLSGTFIWLQLGVCYIIALLIGVGGDSLAWSLQAIDLESISSMTSSVCTLVAFMVGLCVSAALARWWQMRDACLGGLWGCAYSYQCLHACILLLLCM